MGEIVSYNFSAIVLGPPGFGKTTIVATLVRRHLEVQPSLDGPTEMVARDAELSGMPKLAEEVRGRRAPRAASIVFVHDPVFQFAKHGCAVYKDADEWRRKAAAAAAAKQGMPRGASIGGDAESVTRLALELGERVNRADDVRVKILLAYDEGSLIETSGSTHIGTLDNQLEATRRHRGVGIVRNLQQPTQLMSRFWLMCTDAFILRATSKQAKQLDDLLLLEPGELTRAGCSRLERYRYIHVRPGEGIVSEAA